MPGRCFVGRARRAAISSAPIALLVLLVLAALPAFAARPVDPAVRAAAWDALWSNHLARADSGFVSLVSQDARDAASLRGLMLAQMARGKDDELVASLVAYTKLLPASPYDVFLPDFIDENTGLGSRSFYDVLLRYTEKLAEAKSLSVVDRRWIIGKAIYYALMAGRTGRGQELAKELNRVDYWALLGPFDNTSGCGHAKRHLPSWSVTPDTVRGKFGQRIFWFKPMLVGLDRSITPSRHFSRDAYTTAYVRTNFDLPQAGTYLFSVSYTGDMTFTLNRTFVHEGSRRLGGDEVLHWLVDLPAGPNRLAFKVSNRDEDSRLACGISNPDGSAVDGIAFTQMKNAMPDSSACSAPRLVESELLAEVARLAAASPADGEAAFWNLRRAIRREDPEFIRALADSTARNHRDSALMLLAVSQALERAGDEDGARARIRAAAVADVTLVQSRLSLAQLDLENERIEKALAAARAVGRSAPYCRRALEVEVAALIARKDMEELRILGEQLVPVLRDDALPRRALMIYAESRSDKNSARRHRNEYVRRLPPGTKYMIQAQEFFEKDDPASARDDLMSLVEVAPEYAWLWAAYVHSLIASRDYDAAKSILALALASFPQDVGLLSVRAGLAEAGVYGGLTFSYRSQQELVAKLGKQEEASRALAAEILDTALNCDPTNFEIRDRLRVLRNEPPYRTYLPDPDPDAISKRRVEPGSYPGEDAVVLLDQRRRFLFDSQADLRDHVLAVQVLTPAGVEGWETYGFPLSRDMNDLVVLLSRTLKPDGAIKEARRAPASVVFSDVAPGDILLLHYQVTAHSTGALYGEIWDQHIFPFPQCPCRESSYTLIRPAGRPVKSRLWHADNLAGATFNEKSLDGGFVQQQWQFTDLPRTGAEPLAAHPLAHAPWLDISTISGWGVIANWYADLAEGQAEINGVIRAKARELTRDARDDEDRIRRLLRFVANEITYQSLSFFQSAYVPRRAEEVLRDRFGDCKDKCCLLIALCRAAGIDGCTYALTTPGAPPTTKFLPSPRFSHVVMAWRRVDGTLRWYDPTVRHPDPDEIPLPLAGAPALVIAGDTRDLTPLGSCATERSPIATTTRLVIDAHGDGRLTREVTYRHGDRLSALRGDLESIADAALSERASQELAVQFPGASVLSASVNGRTDVDSCLVLTSDASVPEFAPLDAGVMSLRLPWTTALGDLLGTVVAKEERRTPIDLRALNGTEQDEVLVKLPAGLAPSVPPEGVSLNWKGCRYATSFAAAPDGLTARRSLVITGAVVECSDYAGFKEFLDGVRRDLRRTYHLRLR